MKRNPVAPRAMSFGSVTQSLERQHLKNQEFAKTTGLCCICRKNTVDEAKDPLRCETCRHEPEIVFVNIA